MKDESPLPRTVRTTDSEADETLASPPRLHDFKDRYVDQKHVERGGFSDVFKAWDVHVKRYVAIKIQRTDRTDADDFIRFRREVEITAHLQHPGVVPVYDWGQTRDERFWFAMKFVEGETIASRIQNLHKRTGGVFVTELRRLLDDFRRLCETMAYAHEQRIIHRDIKPGNFMVGKLGEVLVMDWGLARDLQQNKTTSIDSESAGNFAEGDPSESILRTRIAGTPHYMPPEQAHGDIQAMGPHSDVYALGAVLYEILCGKPPYASTDGSLAAPSFIVEKVRREAPTPIRDLVCRDIAPELLGICERAMARASEHRYAHAGELMVALRDWLDGAHREERARNIVTEAKHHHKPRIAEKRAQVNQLRRQAHILLDRLHSYDKAQDKAEAWKLQDDAAILEQQALQEEARYIQKLRSALEASPRCEEAHAALAEHYEQAMLRAGEVRDVAAITSFTALVEEHQQYLRTELRHHHETILRGDGRLSLETIPVLSQVVIKRYQPENRYLIAKEQLAGTFQTPLRDVVLPHGSYLVQISASGCRDVAYPVLIGRDTHWDGVRPSDARGFPIELPGETELGPDDIYIPAGWFIAGGDANAGESLPRRRIWVDAFIIRRFPVTNAEFVEFLNRLVAEGRSDEAFDYCPRLSAGTSLEKQPTLAYLRDKPSGFYSLQKPDTDPLLPVVQIHWHAAMAYAKELSRRTGLAWRLPSEIEWEKAARGVDGRYMPWGDQLEPTWACVAGSRADAPRVMPVSAYPTDVSPYGVRGMAGNVKDWCIDRWHIDGPRVDDNILQIDAEWPSESPQRLIRGSAWISVAETMRLASRYAGLPTNRHGALGFRLARSYKPIT